VSAQQKIQYVYEISLLKPFQQKSSWTDKEHRIQKGHLAYLENLTQSGVLEIAGIKNLGLAEQQGIILLNVENHEKAKEISSNDPSVKEGMMTANIYPFQTFFKNQTLESLTPAVEINGSTLTNSGAEVAALNLFYKAFNERDSALMQQSWLNTDDISMDNPIGGIRRGWDEISKGYEKIFKGKAKVYVEFYDYSIHSTGNMFSATGRERGYFKIDDTEIALDIRTSRIFVLDNKLWKQIHHHGSIDNPHLLAKYQTAVLGKSIGE